MSKSIAKNAIYKLLLNIFNIIVPLLVGSYVLRVLQDIEMGKVNYAQSVYQYFYIFATFGVYQYGLREISRVKDDKEKLSKVFTNIFLITLITNLVIGIIYIVFMNTIFLQNSIHTMAIIMTMNFLSNIFYVEWAAEGLEYFDFITIKTIIVQSIYSILVIIMVKSSSDANIYVALMAVALFVNYVISFIYVKRKISFNFKYINIKNHIKPMVLVVILSNANILYTNLDKLMLGSLINPTVVAYYTTALAIAYIINNLLLTFVHVTIPRLSFFVAHDNIGEYTVLLNKISKIYLMILFPAAIGLYVVGRECIIIYGGMDFINAVPLMSCFAFYMITVGYENIISNQIMYLMGKEKEQVKYVFVGGAINLFLNTALYSIGIFTARTSILTTIFANGVLVILEYIYIKNKLKLEINLFGLDKIKYFFISLIFIPVTIVIRTFVSGIFSLLIVIVGVNVLLYFSILLIIRDELLLEGIKLAKKYIKYQFNK